MIKFLTANWFKIIISVGVLYGFYRDWHKSKKSKSEMHTLKTNCIKTIEKDVKKNTENILNLTDDIKNIDDKIEKVENDVSFIKGKLNGKQD